MQIESVPSGVFSDGGRAVTHLRCAQCQHHASSTHSTGRFTADSIPESYRAFA